MLDKARLLSLDSPQQKEEGKDNKQAFQDPSFVDELLSQIQDIDQNNPEIQSAISQMKEEEKKEDKK